MHLLSPSQKFICILFGFLVFFNAVQIQAEEEITEEVKLFDELEKTADIAESDSSSDDGSSLTVGSLKCGNVFDGRNGDDVDIQHSRNIIQGHWSKFADDSKTKYEYAVVSEGAAPSYVRGYVTTNGKKEALIKAKRAKMA